MQRVSKNRIVWATILVVLQIVSFNRGGGVSAARSADAVGAEPSPAMTVDVSNPIVVENQQAGTSQWRISLFADDGAGQIKGYASAVSVNKGENITFHVSVNPAQTYNIDVFRLGWYQGLGARLMAQAGPLDGIQQPTCPTDPTTGMIECQWADSYVLTTDTSWTSGIYLARLTNAAGYQNYIEFALRDDTRSAALVYQQPVTTYQAYNNYPYDNATGKSLYDFNSYGPTTVGGSKAAVKVSFDRPYMGDGTGRDWGNSVFYWEIPFIRWMEKSGYDVSYSTDIDTHTNGARLLNYRGFLSVGHDEYWSKAMYDAVVAARDAGVNLGFFGPNAIYTQTRFEPSTTGVPNRVQVVYRDAALDPEPDPSLKTVNWRDPILNRPEQTLVGVQFTSQVLWNPQYDGYVPYVVTNSGNWVYAGTGFVDGDSVLGLVGYETDRQFTEFPSPTAVSGTYTLLSNSPYTNNRYTADYANSSVYQAPSGAWVFAAGTMGWSYALDNFNFTVPDPRIQQTTANILTRFVEAPVGGDTGNTAPVANAQSVTTNEDTATAITLTASDVDGNTLTYSVVTGPAHGTLSGTAPSVTYTPAAGYSGSDSFTFKANDGTADSNVATVSITVTHVNHAPVANAQSVTTLEDAAAAIALTASDVDGDTLTYSVVTGPAHGTLSGTAPNVTYTPSALYSGPDSFTFKANDYTVDSNVATVSITVTHVNHAPVANAQSVTTLEDGAAAIALTAGDVDGDTLTYSVVTAPAHGTLSGSPPSVTYTPTALYYGSDSFTFKVNDGTADSNVATVSITVTHVNHAPVANAQSVTANQDIAKAITLTASDVDSDTLTYSVVTGPAHGSLSGIAPSVTYTPAAGYSGSDSVTFTANDGTVDSNVATVSITVTPKPTLSVNNPSVIEGNGGCNATTPMPFAVTLSAASNLTVTVNYQTLNGTATGDTTCGSRSKGYLITSGTLTFAPGETSKTVNVQIVGDTFKESSQTLALRFSNATNATGPSHDAIGTIVDDDSTPKLSVSSASLVEGNSGQKQMVFAVTPTNGNELQMSASFSTIAGSSARENIDYLATAGTVIFPPYTTDPQFITVPIVGNLRHQPTHKFFVRLLNAVEALLDGIDGEGDIVDDDPPPTISISDATVGEANSGAVNAVLTVTLSNDTDDVVTVNYNTSDGSAVAGSDYVAASGTLTFQPGQMSQVITLTVNQAAMGELVESFNVDLSIPANGTLNKSRGIVTITPPTSWVTSTGAEFSASGSTVGTGAYLSDTAGGEIILAPAVGAEFSDTSLPAGWTSSVLQTGGSATVANGSVSVDGASVLAPSTYSAGHTLEFVATFSGAADQNAGFGLTSALIPPFAMFGVKSDGQLYARSVAPGQAFETAIPGSWFTASHRFRIDWNATTVVYWIDGTQRVTHTITFKGATSNLRPAITDLTVDGAPLVVDWMRMSAYAASGVYTSPVYDAGAAVAWQALTWTADSVAGSNTIAVAVRTGSTPDLTSAPWTPVASGQALNATAQYAQYKVTLSTSVANATPAVKEVVLTFLR